MQDCGECSNGTSSLCLEVLLFKWGALEKLSSISQSFFSLATPEKHHCLRGCFPEEAPNLIIQSTNLVEQKIRFHTSVIFSFLKRQYFFNILDIHASPKVTNWFLPGKINLKTSLCKTSIDFCGL